MIKMTNDRDVDDRCGRLAKMNAKSEGERKMK